MLGIIAGNPSVFNSANKQNVPPSGVDGKQFEQRSGFTTNTNGLPPANANKVNQPNAFQ